MMRQDLKYSYDNHIKYVFFGLKPRKDSRNQHLSPDYLAVNNMFSPGAMAGNLL